jgi:hypothetical protein
LCISKHLWKETTQGLWKHITYSWNPTISWRFLGILTSCYINYDILINIFSSPHPTTAQPLKERSREKDPIVNFPNNFFPRQPCMENKNSVMKMCESKNTVLDISNLNNVQIFSILSKQCQIVNVNFSHFVMCNHLIIFQCLIQLYP